MHAKHPGPIELVALGASAAVEATFAAAVAPIPVSLKADTSAFHGTDDDFIQYFNVPGIQLAGGWPAAEQLTRNARIR
jgi:hypothetical protein